MNEDRILSEMYGDGTIKRMINNLIFEHGHRLMTLGEAEVLAVSMFNQMWECFLSGQERGKHE